jgi:hypothetical protein
MTSKLGCGRVKKDFGVIVVVGLLSGLWPSFAALAQTETPNSNEPTSSPTTMRHPSAKSIEDWHVEQRASQPDKEGCYMSSYPKGWKKVDCVTAPQRPYLHAVLPPPAHVGGGNDPSATTPALIYSAIGSFPRSDVANESGQVNNTGPAVADAFSLQLNTQQFATSLCNGQPAACQAWQGRSRFQSLALA